MFLSSCSQLQSVSAKILPCAITIGKEDVVPTVGQALKELVAVVDEHKKVRAILYSRILDQENHLAVVREMVTAKQGEI